VIRAAGLGIAGPGARNVPGFGALVTFAVLGGLAAPGLRRGIVRLRRAEQRLRGERISRYVAASHLNDEPSPPHE